MKWYLREGDTVLSLFISGVFDLRSLWIIVDFVGLRVPFP